MLKGITGTRVWILATSLLLMGQTVFAETFVCDDGFCVFGPTDTLDNVIVEGDGILLLEGTTVTGNILVRDGGVLAASGVTIGGNVTGNKAFLIDLVVSTIEGNVEIKNTGGEGTVFGLLPSVDLLGSEVGGNVEIKDNDVNFIAIAQNDITGNLAVKNNTARLFISIASNLIGGNLQCQNNSPPPTGGGNMVSGNVDEDCAYLVL